MEEKKIIKLQIQLLHIGKGKLGLSEDQYREMLSDYWVQSSVDLSYSEASELLNKMVKMGFKIIAKRHDRRLKPAAINITQLPSKEILWKIEHLKQDVNWIIKPDGYKRWLKKYMKIERPRTMAEAQKIVEALKAMKDRQQRAKQMEQRTADEEGLRRDGGMHGGRWQW